MFAASQPNHGARIQARHETQDALLPQNLLSCLFCKRPLEESTEVSKEERDLVDKLTRLLRLHGDAGRSLSCWILAVRDQEANACLSCASLLNGLSNLHGQLQDIEDRMKHTLWILLGQGDKREPQSCTIPSKGVPAKSTGVKGSDIRRLPGKSNPTLPSPRLRIDRTEENRLPSVQTVPKPNPLQPRAVVSTKLTESKSQAVARVNQMEDDVDAGRTKKSHKYPGQVQITPVPEKKRKLVEPAEPRQAIEMQDGGVAKRHEYHDYVAYLLGMAMPPKQPTNYTPKHTTMIKDPFACQFCFKVFTTERHKDRHEESTCNHSTAYRDRRTSSIYQRRSKKTLHCCVDDCDATFSNLKQFDAHYVTHEGKRLKTKRFRFSNEEELSAWLDEGDIRSSYRLRHRKGKTTVHTCKRNYKPMSVEGKGCICSSRVEIRRHEQGIQVFFQKTHIDHDV